MKPIARLVVTTVGVALVAPAHAQIDCAAWNTKSFFLAAEVSDVPRCLQAGADLEARGAGGHTPLHVAAAIGNAEAIAALTAAGAKLEARAEGGLTPLHVAVLSGNAEAIEALLRAGPDLEAQCEKGTALHVAALGGTAEAVMALLKAGADPKVRNNSDELPFDYARDNEKLQGTDAYWELYQAQFE